MFKSVEALDASKHASLTYKGVPGYAFARELASAPLAAAEMADAARHYPIVFSGEGRLLPVAVLSLKRGEAPFVTEKGDWAVDYVPAHIRRYPFVLGETGSAERFLVMIDRAAAQFSADDGERLFVDGQAPADGVVERAKQFLAQFQRQLVQTETLLRPLEETGVLVARQFTVTRGEQTEVAVSGFRQVDAEALAKLDDATLAGWVRSGLMAVVIAHLHSLANAERLLRRQETAGAAA